MMFDSDIHQEVKVQPLFYFKYPMKLEFIPFIEQQVQQFITFASKIIEVKQKINQILIIVNKKIKDIDNFYRQYWSDYRANQILRSKKILINFCQQNHQTISERIVNNSNIKKQIIKKTDIPKNIKTQIVQIDQKEFINIKDNRKNSHQKIELHYNEPNLINKDLQTPFMIFNKPNNRDQSQNKNTSSKNKYPYSPKIQTKMKESPKIGSDLKPSPKITPKINKKQPQKKITKQQYIEYLRNKKQSS